VHYPNNYDFTRIIEFKHIHPVDVKRTTICFEYPKEYTTENDERYYPVLTKESKATWLKYADLAREYHVVPLGRVGEFRYYNMSEAVESALRAFNDIAK
jgi:UDP-galactopyranose mutase